MKYILTFLILLTCFGSVSARRTEVSSAAAINFGSWSAGDTIVMLNGTWTNQVISFKANGTEAQPIVLEAETPGMVILNGSSRLAFSGKYIVVSGLYFLNGTLSGSDVIAFRTSGSEFAENCTLANTTIASYNPSLNTVDSKWVSVYGKNNRVEHCSFENKNNSGTLLVVWLSKGVSANHVIASNYFGYRNSNLDKDGKELNGQEIIRIGDSDTSMTGANVTVEGNFFEKCNGEIEIISNKSCGNRYLNNLFLECRGMLTLRHGNNCTVDGNYFFGNGIAESGGVRIIGEDHKVYNNYFENLRGTNYRSAICIVRGKENSLLKEYFQVKNALVAFNTMVDCSQSFSVNYFTDNTHSLPPVGSVVAHNHIYNTASNYTNVNIDQNFISAMDVMWKNNLMNQGKYTGFSYNSTQIITGKDANMTLVATPINMYEPGSTSALINYTTTEYPEINTDIRGRERGLTAKLTGSSQISGTINKVMPQKSNVGAAFFDNPTLNLKPAYGNTDQIKLHIESGKVTIFTEKQQRIKILNISGSLISDKVVNSSFSVQLNKGIYLIQFVNDNQRTSTQKFIVQ
jgi:poly(beta-D-mannuronate) lyase